MDALNVAKAVRGGLSIFCASCKHYWQGRERGLPDPKCTAPAPCGSIFAGMAFPEYIGPITDRTRWCFVCGSSADHAVAANGQSQPLGMCSKHLPLLQTIRQVDPLAPDLEGIDVVTRGKVIPLKELYRKPRKSLGRDIAEAEAYFEEQRLRGKKG